MKLDVCNLSFSYKDKIVLNGINLAAESGSVIAVLGANGSGKTTFFKIILDFIKPKNGKVLFDGKEKTGICAGIIETPLFWNGMCGLDNLKYYLANEYDEKTVFEYADKWGLKESLNTKVNKYSLGMKQKLSMILAFSSKREILIFDEPLNSLDQHSIGVFFECVTKAKSENKIIILATHIVYELDRYCDKIYELKDGCLLEHIPTNNEYKITFISSEKAQEAANKIKENSSVIAIGDSIIVSVENNEISEVIKRLADYNIIGVERKTL